MSLLLTKQPNLQQILKCERFWTLTHEKVPDGINILMLPPYSPELNQIEKLWHIIQDHTSNKRWPFIQRLGQVVGLLLKDWWDDPQWVIRLIGNNWHRASAN